MVRQQGMSRKEANPTPVRRLYLHCKIGGLGISLAGDAFAERIAG
jgi:hypothetical protein